MSKKVLMVVTSSDKITGTEHSTGLWLEEFAVPFFEFKAKNYALTVASPQGGATPIDPRSQPKPEEVQKWRAALAALENTLPLEKIQAADYDAVFLPGGHGTMFDLPDNAALQALLRETAEHNKIVAAVCHGPAGLVGVRLSNGQPLVAGKTVTGFTNSEEKAAQLDKVMPFLLESRLVELGAKFVPQADWSDHVERDGKLITGQNPQSSASVAKAVIEALEA